MPTTKKKRAPRPKLVRLQWLPERYLDTLRQAGVRLIPYDGVNHLTDAGAVPEITRLLNARSVLHVPTETRGLKEVLLQIEAPKFEPRPPDMCSCFVGASRMAAADFSNLVIELLGSWVGKGQPINVHDRGGEVESLERAGETFKILMYCSPVRGSQGEVPETIWGQDEYFNEDGLMPSGEGIPIMSGVYTVAEFFPGRALYVMHRITDDNGKEDFAIARRLFQSVAALAQFSPEDLKALQEQLKRSRGAHQARFYADRLVRDVEKMRDGLSGTIADAEADLDEARVAYVKALRNIEGLRRKRAKKVDLEELRKRKLAEFETICAMPAIVSVKLDHNWMKIVTKPMVCTRPDTGRRYALGSFQVDIPFADWEDDHSVCFRNLSGTRDCREGEFHHPHVDSSGHACFGNIDQAITEFLGTGEYAAAVTLIISFLETMNPADYNAGTIENWPEAEEPSANQREEVAHV